MPCRFRICIMKFLSWKSTCKSLFGVNTMILQKSITNPWFLGITKNTCTKSTFLCVFKCLPSGIFFFLFDYLNFQGSGISLFHILIKEKSQALEKCKAYVAMVTNISYKATSNPHWYWRRIRGTWDEELFDQTMNRASAYSPIYYRAEWCSRNVQNICSLRQNYLTIMGKSSQHCYQPAKQIAY